ncbi:hypothetical protein I545_3606 [Mycobacterium kansasii 662]|uniref:Uncharacterized protein n=2 Tax=Mycobacterium kansasii TaxID=1768 RepID=A0A1V3XED7_MYCKA|nr:hypothetical protein I547_5634 [Mycobacterium kansasii 824]EUA16855.1 hypothetical protein I545_3606 [Mycobacterium kansasii 662]OOK77532.1 hypothetical protein BZL29_3901 [Mycobacterium kansasii]
MPVRAQAAGQRNGMPPPGTTLARARPASKYLKPTDSDWPAIGSSGD